MSTLGINFVRRNGRQGAESSRRCLLLLAIFLSGAGVANILNGRGAMDVVTNLDDGGPGSLRDAIATAQAGDTISFAVRGTIVLTNGELLISQNLKIAGPGATNLAISAARQSRVLEIYSNAVVNLSGLTICDGHAADGAVGTSNSPAGGDGGDGGGIYNAGSLILAQCMISNCAAGDGGAGYQTPYEYNVPPEATNWVAGVGGGGGAIYNTGKLLLTGCSLIANSSGTGGNGGGNVIDGASGNSGGGGGAIYNAGTMVLTRCQFEHNATGHGGAAYSILYYSREFPDAEHGGAGGVGGGVCDSGQTTTFVNGCQFISNTSGAGGIGGNTNTAYFAGTDFGGPGGAGGAGGAMWVGRSMRMVNCAFLSNQTGAGGGGAFGLTNGGAGGIGGSGGAIYCLGQLSMVDCSCVSNQVGGGSDGGFAAIGLGGAGASGGNGGAICAISDVNLTGCSLDWNNAGPSGNGGGSGSGLGGASGIGGLGGAIC
ncbi:MAG TPA: hypothetical protein VGI88_00685, partial [Verrucomicrobiae bacterium]